MCGRGARPGAPPLSRPGLLPNGTGGHGGTNGRPALSEVERLVAPHMSLIGPAPMGGRRRWRRSGYRPGTLMPPVRVFSVISARLSSGAISSTRCRRSIAEAQSPCVKSA